MYASFFVFGVTISFSTKRLIGIDVAGCLKDFFCKEKGIFPV